MMNENEIYSVKLPWFGYIHYMVRFRQKKKLLGYCYEKVVTCVHTLTHVTSIVSFVYVHLLA